MRRTRQMGKRELKDKNHNVIKKMNCHLNKIEIVYKYQTFIFFILYFMMLFLIFFSRSPFFLFGFRTCIQKMVSIVSPFLPLFLSLSLSTLFPQPHQFTAEKSEQGKKIYAVTNTVGLLSLSLPLLHSLHSHSNIYSLSGMDKMR